MLTFPPRYVRSRRPHGFKWAANLDGDTIAAAVVTVTGTDLVVSQTAYNDSIVTFYLTGGKPGKTETITCFITTARGDTDEVRATIRCN
jgi:hypothetical protein